MDIISKILHYADINDLENFSKTDDRFNKILSKRYFWLSYFTEHYLQLPKESYDNVHDWINIFNKSKHTYNVTLLNITLLSFNYKLNIKDIVQLDKYLQNTSMDIFLNWINNLKLKNPNVDFIYDIKIQNQNNMYNIVFISVYDGKREITGAIIEKVDLHKIIYSLIYDNFRVESVLQ